MLRCTLKQSSNIVSYSLALPEQTIPAMLRSRVSPAQKVHVQLELVDDWHICFVAWRQSAVGKKVGNKFQHTPNSSLALEMMRLEIWPLLQLLHAGVSHHRSGSGLTALLQSQRGALTTLHGQSSQLGCEGYGAVTTLPGFAISIPVIVLPNLKALGDP